MSEIFTEYFLEDLLNILPILPDNSVDSIVTDGPYGLKFMGKKWDYKVPSVEMWEACLRVLKPGGYLLAFAGTRTQHRMACNIEDAGFEIRDMIAWVYGNGFPKSLNVGIAVNKLESKEWLKIGKGIDILKNSNIFDVWKRNSNNVSFVETQLEKNQIEIGTNTLKNDSVQGDVLQKTNQEKLNVPAIIAEISFGVHQVTNTKISIVQKNAEVNTKQLQNHVRFVEKLSQSHNHLSMSIFIVQENVKELLKENPVAKIRVEEALKTLRGNQKYSNEVIINVLSVVLTDILKLTILNQSKTFQNLDMTLQMECVSAINVTITEYIAECLIINMVNIAKKIIVDKLQGNEREIIGKSNRHGGGIVGNGTSYEVSPEIPMITKGTSEYEGWGTALKPAMEMITVARKPLSEKTVAENVLKWGTGGINIDESRVSLNGDYKSKSNGRPSLTGLSDKYNSEKANISDTQGRFPANLIHDGSVEVKECFPNTKSGKDNFKKQTSKDKEGNTGSAYGAESRGYGTEMVSYGDEGSASRFFYCAKTNKKDRNEGCENLFFEKIGNDEYQLISEEIFNELDKDKRVQGNFHPTVKPTNLMRYLVKLVTPKGGIVLDPFAGSGSTGKACVIEGFSCILIEKQESSYQILEARIEYQKSITD